MPQVLANPESSSPPKSNYPLKVDTSKLISLSAKITDMIDTLNKCHTDPRFINNDYLTFLFITLDVQDIHYLFLKIIFCTFLAILFFEVPMWSTCFSHQIHFNDPSSAKVAIEEGC